MQRTSADAPDGFALRGQSLGEGADRGVDVLAERTALESTLRTCLRPLDRAFVFESSAVAIEGRRVDAGDAFKQLGFLPPVVVRFDKSQDRLVDAGEFLVLPVDLPSTEMRVAGTGFYLWFASALRFSSMNAT